MLLIAAARPLTAGAQAPLQLEPVAEGVYVAPGRGLRAAPENGGHIAHTGVIIGPRGVVVIDPGPTAAHGARLRAAIGRLTPLPVVLVINTHPQAEAVLANSAFAEVPIRAHPAAVQFMRARCEACLAALRERLGDAALEGTAIVLPEAVAVEQVVDAGGRRLRLLPFASAATAGDLAVLDEATGTLFAGALAAGAMVPELRDGDLTGWNAALARLARIPHRRVVPGRGAQQGDALADTSRYLAALAEATMREVAAGADLAAVEAALPEFAAWPGYADHHPANVRRAFVHAEARWLLGR